MIETFKKDIYISVTFVFFILYSLFWLYVQTTPIDSFLHNLFSDTYGLITVWGGISGLIIAKKWGGFKSLVGRAINMFALGLLSVSYGQFVYSYYYFKYGIDMAYPNIGDLGYFASIFFYIYGSFLIAQVCGIQIKLKNIKNQLFSLSVLLVLLWIPYKEFLTDYTFDWSQIYRIILDLGTPMAQAVYLFIALITYILSRNSLGGIMKDKILALVLALSLQYVADFVYIYQQSYDELSIFGFQFGGWIAGGFTEYLFFLSYTVITLAILQLNLALKELQVNNKQ